MPRRIAQPDPRAFNSLIDIVDDAAERYGGVESLAFWREDESDESWSFRELQRRSELAAWRLRHDLGLIAGDRFLTLSPSTPAVPAVYFGAMLAGLLFVPLDSRMSRAAMQRIAERSGARALAYGTGRDARAPKDGGLERFPARSFDELTAEPPSAADEEAWRAEVRSRPRPTRDDVFEIVYTSGTTGTPKGVMVNHGMLLATIEGGTQVIEPLEHRVVSVLPLSHLFEQLVVPYALTLGAPVAYVRWRTPRALLEAMRKQRVTTMVVVPQILELFWNAITREIDRRGARRTFDSLRSVARRFPYPVRRWIFRSIHAQLGGHLNLFLSAGAFLPPSLQQGWEDLGVIVQQGYGATETGLATVTTKRDHGLGTVGRVMPPNEVRLAPDGEILVRGPAVFPGYWDDPEATKAAFDEEGFYHTADVGHWDAEGHLILSGRKKNMIVLPNGFNVFPEDVENELHMAGIREAVVLETTPGRIEAIILPGEGPGLLRSGEGARAVDAEGDSDRGAANGSGDGSAHATAPISDAERARIDSAVKEANRKLGILERVAGWRLWPYEDFPRTHTLKVKRDLVRAWLDQEAPIKIREGG